MKKKFPLENVIFLLFFIVVVAYPYVAAALGIKNDLTGAEEKVEFKFENLDDYIIQNFPGKSILVKTRNQILYSLFDISPNISVTKVDDTLLAVEPLNYYYHGEHALNNEAADDLIYKFKDFKNYCDENGKRMLIIITPDKPRYYTGPLPFADDVINAYQENLGLLPYEIFKYKLSKTDIKYFDTIDIIEKNKDELVDGEVPLFYKSGHHWSTFKGNMIGLKLREYLVNEFDLTLPKITIKASPSEVPVYPDADLYGILNLYGKPNEKFYSTVLNYHDYYVTDQNFTISGGSFLGELLIPNYLAGYNNEIVHIENKVFFCDNYKKQVSFESYDELNDKYDLLAKVKNTDIFIFEINELNIYNATFGFLDYMLSHKGEI